MSAELNFEKADGLVTAVVQDHQTGRVLMVGYMNPEAFERTVSTGVTTFWSRSRQKLWIKGESSGHKMLVKNIAVDCDEDAVLVTVEAIGPGVCHTGHHSCFYRSLSNGAWTETEERTYDPDAIYGAKH